MDLIRRMALAAEAQPLGGQLTELEGVDPSTFFQHAVWLEEAGLAHCICTPLMGDEYGVAVVLQLTWAGCEFVDAARNDTLWAKAKTSVLKPGLSFSFDLLKDWLKAEIQQGFPTVRAVAQ